MCVIIRIPAGSKIPTDYIRGYYGRNSHGIGVMFYDPDKEKVIVRKNPKPTEEEAVKMVEEFQSDKYDLFVHMRLRTHGEVNITNTHPYQVLSKRNHGRDLWLMHNGVLKHKEVDKKWSDTFHFVKYFLRPILKANYDLLFDDHFRHYIEDLIGTSKLALVDDDGSWVVFNNKSGTVLKDKDDDRYEGVEGIWVSNTMNMKARTPTRSYQSNYSGGTASDWRGRHSNPTRQSTNSGTPSAGASVGVPSASTSGVLTEAEKKRALELTNILPDVEGWNRVFYGSNGFCSYVPMEVSTRGDTTTSTTAPAADATKVREASRGEVMQTLNGFVRGVFPNLVNLAYGLESDGTPKPGKSDAVEPTSVCMAGCEEYDEDEEEEEYDSPFTSESKVILNYTPKQVEGMFREFINNLDIEGAVEFILEHPADCALLLGTYQGYGDPWDDETGAIRSKYDHLYEWVSEDPETICEEIMTRVSEAM